MQDSVPIPLTIFTWTWTQSMSWVLIVVGQKSKSNDCGKGKVNQYFSVHSLWGFYVKFTGYAISWRNDTLCKEISASTQI